MRDGRLLSESPPDSLIQSYGLTVRNLDSSFTSNLLSVLWNGLKILAVISLFGSGNAVTVMVVMVASGVQKQPKQPKECLSVNYVEMDWNKNNVEDRCVHIMYLSSTYISQTPSNCRVMKFAVICSEVVQRAMSTEYSFAAFGVSCTPGCTCYS